MDETAELRAGIRFALSTIRKMRNGETTNVDGAILKLEELRRTATRRANFKKSAQIKRIRIEKHY